MIPDISVYGGFRVLSDLPIIEGQAPNAHVQVDLARFPFPSQLKLIASTFNNRLVGCISGHMHTVC